MPFDGNIKWQYYFTMLNGLVKQILEVICLIFKLSVLFGINDITRLYKLIETVVDKCDYNIRVFRPKKLRIVSKDVAAYKKIISVVREHILIDHTFISKDERDIRL